MSSQTEENAPECRSNLTLEFQVPSFPGGMRDGLSFHSGAGAGGGGVCGCRLQLCGLEPPGPPGSQ